MSRRIEWVLVLSLAALLVVLAYGVLINEGSTEESAEAHDHEAHGRSAGEYVVTPEKVKGTLRTEVDGGLSYVGIFAGSGTSVELQSRQAGIDGIMSPRAPEATPGASPALRRGTVTTADLIKASLTIKGKRIDVREDLNKGTVTFDPHERALTKADKTAIIGAYYDFEGRMVPLLERAERESKGAPVDWNSFAEHPRLNPTNPLDPQDDLLLRTLMFLSEAPVGVPLTRDVVYQPKPHEIEIEGEVAAAEDASSSGYVSPETTTLGDAACADDAKFLPVELVACRNPNDDQLYVHSCWTGNRQTHHDDSEHCFKQFTRRSGRYTDYCVGRCGIGCGRSNGLGIYTKDCLDHDFVVQHVGYTAFTAQDEFNWTDDDALYGQRHPGKKCRR